MLSPQRLNPHLLCFLLWQVGFFFTTSATWQAQGIVIGKHEINVLASLFQESGKHMMHLGNALLSKSLKDNP